MKVYEGSIAPPKGEFVIVVSRFNRPITSNLLRGAQEALINHGVPSEKIHVAYVPGAYEVPVVAQAWAKKSAVSAVICLGVVIQGDTPHFDYVAGEAARGIQDVALNTEKPIIFGVLTVNTLEQAIERSTDATGNKGAEAALTAIEMTHLMSKI